MIRKIVKIDEEKCNGCGVCVPACAEGAIAIIDGKARVVKESLCDGLGACLGECPQGAITIEEREAEAFDATQVEKHLKSQGIASHLPHQPAAVISPHPHISAQGCPGSRAISFTPSQEEQGDATGTRLSQLRQWPIQLHLVSPSAPYFQGADLLLAADCVAFAVGDFHKDFLAGHRLAIACPKLDANQQVYRQKLTMLVEEAKINTLTVMVMEVPCCAGLLRMAQQAVAEAKRKIPIKRRVVSLRGEILSEEWV